MLAQVACMYNIRTMYIFLPNCHRQCCIVVKIFIFEDKVGDLPNVFIYSCKQRMNGCEFGQS